MKRWLCFLSLWAFSLVSAQELDLEKLIQLSKNENLKHTFKFGVDNSVFFLNTGAERVVIKKYTKKGQEDVARIALNGDGLTANGFPVPKTLAQLVLDDHPCLVLEYMRGDHPLIPSSSQIYIIGIVMAQFHMQPFNKDLLAPCRPFDAMDDFFSQSASFELKSDLQAHYHPETFKTALENPLLFKGPLHGDFSPSNVLMEGDEVTAILDIDHMCYGPAIVDLARSLIFFCFDAEGNFLPDTMKTLVSGYETVRVLSADEKKLLNPLCQALLTRMILETYYHTAILKDVSMNIFSGYRASQTPDQLFKRWISCHSHFSLSY